METQNERERLLGQAPIPRLMVKLAIPAIIAQLINILYNIDVYKRQVSGLPRSTGPSWSGAVSQPMPLNSRRGGGAQGGRSSGAFGTNRARKSLSQAGF